MRHSSIVEVGDCKYEVTQFPARKANRLLITIAKIIGPSIATVTEHGGLNMKLEGDELGKVVASLTQHTDEEKVDNLLIELFSSTVVMEDNKRTPLQKEIIDIHFAGRLGHMYKVLFKVLEVQYGNFFGEVVGMSKGLPMAQK